MFRSNVIEITKYINDIRLQHLHDLNDTILILKTLLVL